MTHKAHRYQKLTEEERFWLKVRRGEKHECWPWIGARNPNEYGKFKKADGSTVDAHNYSLQLKLGRKLLPGNVARHRCDYRPCCNPEHLLEGTQLHNHRDMWHRGRAMAFGRPLPPPPDSMRELSDPEYCPF